MQVSPLPFLSFDVLAIMINLIYQSPGTKVNWSSRVMTAAALVFNSVSGFRFLDEVQSHCSENKMSVQNLATVFGPNILRPKMEDPVTIMEGMDNVH